MALAKRESARRGLYSRFFRGPVLGPDTEEPQALEVTQRSSPSLSGSNGLRCGVSITEKGKGKRKSREEDGERIGVAQKKRKSKRENETKEEKRERRRLKTLKKEVEMGEVETGPTKVSTAPESSVRPRKTDGKKKRKRKERETAARHDG
jgi:nucleolar protein TMA23